MTHEQLPGSAADRPRVAFCSQITHIFYGLKVLLEGGSRHLRLPEVGSTCSCVYVQVFAFRLVPRAAMLNPGLRLSVRLERGPRKKIRQQYKKSFLSGAAVFCFFFPQYLYLRDANDSH